MRDRDEVIAKFEQLKSKRLAQRKREFICKHHKNCSHNIRLTVKGNGKCGFCRHPEIMDKNNGRPFVCDEEGTARRCKLFDCRNTSESVEEDFEEILSSPSRCGNSYPKLAILIWFLQDSRRRTRSQRFMISFVDVFRSLFALLLGRWW
jgi:hypothetical protein